VSVERFEGSSDPEAYRHSGSYCSTYANFIDPEIIEYYQARYNYQKGQKDPEGVTLKYITNATKLAHVRVVNDQGGSPWRNNTVAFYDMDNSALVTTGEFMNPYAYAFYKDQTGYHEQILRFDVNFSDCYVIEMEFEYSEYYGPTAAFISTVHQIVILDQDLVPVWIGIKVGQYIS
jgi:hypothetical protein